jgi:hypothetical protein
MLSLSLNSFIIKVALLFFDKEKLINRISKIFYHLNIMPKLINNKTIIDLSRIIVGPYATNVLSGFGCNVIKV